jgi:hypothetical protein
MQVFAIGNATLAAQRELMSNPTVDLLLARRSVSANSLGEPGPNEAELELILRAASRVSDHKKLVPWRFLQASSGWRTRRTGSCGRRSSSP